MEEADYIIDLKDHPGAELQIRPELPEIPTLIQLGPSIRLLIEDWYIRAFGSGVTRRGFRALCRAIGVPIIRVGQHNYVEMSRMELAFSAICSLGASNFAIPGSRHAHKVPDDFTSTLDVAELDYENIVREMNVCRSLATGELLDALQRKAKQVARKLTGIDLRNVVMEHRDALAR